MFHERLVRGEMERRLAPTEVEGHSIGLVVVERGQGSLATVHDIPPLVASSGTGFTSV
jgi:hypothetical protein